jgi:hypothetical protein
MNGVANCYSVRCSRYMARGIGVSDRKSQIEMHALHLYRNQTSILSKIVIDRTDGSMVALGDCLEFVMLYTPGSESTGRLVDLILPK